MKILVTGASSFVGRALIPLLLAEHHELFLLSRSSISFEHPGNPDAFTTVRGNFTTLYSARYFPREISVVVHLGSFSPLHNYAGDSKQVKEINVGGAKAVVDFARKHQVGLVLHTSSTSVYGSQRPPMISRATPTSPSDPYGESKLLAEATLRELGPWTRTVSLRLPAVVGRGASRHWLARMLKLAKNDDDLTFYGEKNLYNSVVHVEELARFILALLSSTKVIGNHDSFPVASINAMQVGEIAKIFCEGFGARVAFMEGTCRRDSVVDDSHARLKYGYDSSSVEKVLKQYLLVDSA